MNLSEYLIEAVANRTAGKYRRYDIEGNKESVYNWLELHKFHRYEFNSSDTEVHLRQGRNTYMVGPNQQHRADTDWVSIHSPEVYEMVIWFNQITGLVNKIELRKDNSKGDDISFYEASKILSDIVK